MRALLERAVPIARFEVERALERGDTGTAEGRDRVLEQAAAAIRPLPPSVLREELVQLVAGRLGLTESLVACALAAPRRCASRVRRARSAPRGRTAPAPRSTAASRASAPSSPTAWRCPRRARSGSPTADLDELFSAPATRRAAEYLRGRLRSPAGELPAGDEPLARLVAELVIRAGELEATPAKLELEALQLDLHNLDRRIATARTDGHERIHDLAAERQQVLDAIRHRLS